MSLRVRAAALLLAAAALAGCRADESPNAPDLSNNDGLFRRYVALGTSISAGFQSGGINDSTQARAFPVLVAAQANAPFAYPRLAGRGCPAPLVNNVTQVRVGNQSPSAPCDLRAQPIPTYLNNLAVPGIETADFFSNVATPLSTYERLQVFFLGGQIPVQALMKARPTLVTVELGANELLGAMLSSVNPGNPDSVTSFPVFQANYTRLADSLDRTGAKVAVFTVPDVTVIPFASLGAIYWCLKNGGCPAPLPPADPNFQLNPRFNVAASCAPIGPGVGTTTLVPWTVGIAGFLTSVVSTDPLFSFTLDCANDQQVITSAELQNVVTLNAQYNAFIAQLAAQRGYAVVDANGILGDIQAAGGIPPFPDLSAVLGGGPVGFGPYFSLDGFHPSSLTHEVIADALIATVNAEFGTQVPALP